MSKRRSSVLVAASNEGLREPLAELLRKTYRCEVRTVRLRQDVIPLMRDSKLYDAALLDDLLLSDNEERDRGTCVELIKEMKRIRPTTEILISTGGDPVLSRLALRENAISCEQNPFDLESLAMHVCQAVEFQHRSREKYVLEKLVEINSSLHSGKNEGELLDTILNGVHSFGFDRVRLYLLSEDGNYLEAVAGLGMDADFAEVRLLLTDCYYMNRLLDAGRSLVFNRADAAAVPFEQLLDKADVDEWAGVPMRLKGEIIGKLSVDNKVSGLSILEEDLRAVEVCAAHAATAIQNRRAADRVGRRHESTQRRNLELERENQAFRIMSGLGSVRDTLLSICSQAKEIFNCASATIWPYDTSGQRFIPRELVSDGIPRQILRRLRKTEPSQRGITNTVRKRDWLGVQDICDPSLKFLTPHMRSLLASAGIRSFQAVHLRVGDETVGVLYVSYPTVREFDGEDRRSLERFGAYAALSLKNARSSEQLGREKIAAQAVARVSALGDLGGTLKSVCREMVRLTGCNVAVLYPYDEVRDRLDSPPTYHGKVHYPDRMLRLTEVAPDSRIRKFLDEKRTVPIENTLARSSPLKRSRFTRDEKILSCVVVPLRVADRKVGVMFVNYRSRRRFNGDEIANIQLICRQAAIAVSNAQLFDRLNRQLNGQNDLLQLSGSLLEPLNLKDILRKSVASAAKTLRTDLSNIVLLDDETNPVFRAGVGWPGDMEGYILPRGSGSQTGFTIQERKPVHVYDYALEERFKVPQIVKEQGISSGLSVPMFDRDEVVGALLVHTLRHRRFSVREEQLLQLMANHTAIAIQNATRHQANERKSTQLRALNEAAKAITQSFGADRVRVLNNILEQAVTCILQRQEVDTILGTIQEYDDAAKEMVFIGAHPCDDDAKLVVDTIRKRRSIDRAVEKRIGVIGRTVERKDAQIVADVSKDDDHVVFKWHTGSEITAPLLDNDHVLGVINVESNRVGAFDEEDLETLKALADLVVIALRNSQQYDQLRQIKGLIGSRTALDWMGEIALAWGHKIHSALGSTRNRIAELQPLLEPAGKAILDRLRGSVSEINPDMLMQLVDETAVPIPAWHFIAKYVEDHQKANSGVVFTAPRRIDHRITIRASKSRLHYALGNVVDNAVQAMESAGTRRREITFNIEVPFDLNRLKISISNSGPGIPEKIRDAIGKEKRIEKRPDEKGMGIGLMLARALLSSYDGDLSLADSGPEGTEFTITLPYQLLGDGKQSQ